MRCRRRLLVLVGALITLFTFESSAASASSPLTPFLQKSSALYEGSHALSREMGYPIIYLGRTELGSAEQRTAVLANLHLPGKSDGKNRLDRYRKGIIGYEGAGFAVKPEEAGMPCVISVDGSYDEHVRDDLLEDLTGYPYHPYYYDPAAFEQMVLFHEIAHCFERYGGIKGENFADVFAALMLHRSEQIIDERHRATRWLGLVNGDLEHFSVKTLQLAATPAMQDWSVKQVIAEADQVTNTDGAIPDDETLASLGRQVRFLWLSITIAVTQADIDRAARDPRKEAEAVRNRLIERQEDNRRERDAFRAAMEQKDFGQLRKLLKGIGREMFRVRNGRHDLETEAQREEFRSHVSLLFQLCELELAPDSPDFGSWLATLFKELEPSLLP